MLTVTHTHFQTASLYSCKRPLTINTGGCAGRKWRSMGLYFLQTIIIFVGSDVFQAGRSAYLIFIDDFFCLFQGIIKSNINPLKQLLMPQFIPMQEVKTKKSRQLDGMVLYTTKLTDLEECLQTKLSSTNIHLILIPDTQQYCIYICIIIAYL